MRIKVKSYERVKLLKIKFQLKETFFPSPLVEGCLLEAKTMITASQVRELGILGCFSYDQVCLTNLIISTNCDQWQIFTEKDELN